MGQTVVVIDEEPPKIHGRPKDVTVECLHLPPAPTLTASDNCCEVTLTPDELRDDGSCDSEYKLIRFWDAVDECGHTAHYEYTVTVIDNEPPRFNNPLPENFLKVECDDPAPEPTLTATDNCGDATVTPDHFTHTGTCLDEYAQIRRWIATDICGNQVSHTQTVSVIDSTPPSIELPEEDTYESDDIPSHEEEQDREVTDNCDPNPDLSFQSNLLGADCSDNWSVMLLWVVTDRCGNEAIYSMVVPVDDISYPEFDGIPDDETVKCTLPDVPHVTCKDNCDHRLTPSFEQELPYADCPYVYIAVRRWTCTDRCLNTVTKSQTITVEDDGDPTLSEIPDDIVIGCKDTFVPEKVKGEDHCQKAISVAVDTRVVPGSCPDQYVTIVTWSAEDDCGGFTSDTQTVTVHDDTPPTMPDPKPDEEVECDQIPPPETLFATDDCSYGVEVKYTESVEPGTCDNDYVIVRKWEAHDACGNPVSKEQRIDVTDKTPPTINFGDEDVVVPCDDIPVMRTYTPEDNCGGYLHYKEDENRIDGTRLHDYELHRTWTITDACGNTEVYSVVVSVEDQEPPVLLYAPSDISVECDTYPEIAEVSGQDSCGYAPTVDDVSSENEHSCVYEKDVIYTWTATDECGRTDQHIQTITKEDTTPPVINIHEDITCEIGNVPPPWKCTWSDNCDEDGETDYEVEYGEGSCIHQYTNTYTCIAEDCSGNTATSTHVVHVFDNIPPKIFGVPPDTTVVYQKVPPLEHAHLGISVTDNSDSNAGGNDYRADLNNPTDVIIPGYDANDYTIVRTFSATDACENYVQVEQTITVIDETPPCFDETPEDIEVECDAIPEPCEVFTVGENLEVSFYEQTITTDQYDVVIKRTWTASDHSGNSNEHTQRITVVDSSPPIFTRKPPASLTIDCDCDEFPAMPVVGAIDNCDEFVAVTKSESVDPSALCEETYTVTRKWEVCDHRGNCDDWQQVIEVVDDEAPTFSSDPQDVTFQCHEDTFSTAPKFSVYDNCDDNPSQDTTYNTTIENEHWMIGECIIVYRYTTHVWDACGNEDWRHWSFTFEDRDAPVVQGSKQCVHASRFDGYGSRDLYKQYKLSDMISHDDTCTNTRVTSVFFNRSMDDTTNVFEVGVVPDSTSFSNFHQNSELVYSMKLFTIVDASYYMRVAIAKGPGDATVGSCSIDDGSDFSINFSPYINEGDYKEYDVHYNAVSDTTSLNFRCQGDGYFWQFDQYDDKTSETRSGAVMHTSHGEGFWAKADYTDVPLECSERQLMSHISSRCTSVQYQGRDIFHAIPNQPPRDDRFCYVHESKEWLSITPYSHVDDSGAKEHWC